MMMKFAACGLAMLMATGISGCSAPSQNAQSVQPEKTAKIQPYQMEKQCKDNASRRYNTDSRDVSVVDVASFQRSFELRGYTERDEGFTCLFDEKGDFLHLSMR